MNLPSENTLFKIAAIGFGLICGVAIIAFMEQINVYLHPVSDSAELSAQDVESFYTSNRIYLLGSIIAHATGGFFAGSIPVYFRNDIRPAHTIYIALILMFLAIFNLYSINYPAWYMITNILLYIPCVWAGTRLSKKLKFNS